MRGSPVTFRRLNGGLNVMDSVYTLAEGQGKGPGCESRDCRNVLSTTRGAIRTRYGSSVLAKPAVAIDSLYPLTAVGPRLIAQGGAALYSVDATGAITAITGTSGATAGKRWEWAQAVAQGGQGPLYGMDGSVVAQWTGAGVAAPMTANAGTLPVGKYLVYHGNRLWVAGMAAYTPSGGAALADAGSAVVFSGPGAPRDYPATNVVLFDPGDGEAISGIGTIGPYVLVFKPNKCWVVYDLDTGANRRISVGAGCVSHRSIAESPYGAFFLTKDQGVMTCDGQKVKRMSEPVEPLLLALAPAQRQNAAATWFNGHYYLSISQGGGVNDLTLDYQARRQRLVGAHARFAAVGGLGPRQRSAPVRHTRGRHSRYVGLRHRAGVRSGCQPRCRWPHGRRSGRQLRRLLEGAVPRFRDAVPAQARAPYPLRRQGIRAGLPGAGFCGQRHMGDG
jgi:hypothetical protein